MQRVALIALAFFAGCLIVQQFIGVVSPTPIPDPPPAPAPGPDLPDPPPRPSPMPDHFEFGKVNHATAETLQLAVDSGYPLLVKFGADWCPPCKQLQPNLEEFAAAVGTDVMVLSVDHGESRAVFDGYRVTSLPTLVVMKGSNDVGRKTGVLTARGIARLVDGAVNAN